MSQDTGNPTPSVQRLRWRELGLFLLLAFSIWPIHFSRSRRRLRVPGLVLADDRRAARPAAGPLTWREAYTLTPQRNPLGAATRVG